MYLYRATRHPELIDIGEGLLLNIEKLHKTKCGYATQKSVVDHSLEDRMESFFLAETLKYFYLLFDPDNFLHDHDDRGYFQTGKLVNGCVLDTGGYIFNTEAHPIDPAALQCCKSKRQTSDNDISYLLQNRFNSKVFQNSFKNSSFNIFSDTSSNYKNQWWDLINEKFN